MGRRLQVKTGGLCLTVNALVVCRECLAIGERTLKEKRPNDVKDAGVVSLEVTRCVGGVRKHPILLEALLVILKNFLLTGGNAKSHANLW